jgi:energy-coupling factor transporter ATP-binding protein EcfA2
VPTEILRNPMNSLNVSLKNCYGIKGLDCKFNFGNTKPYSIYAPNGFMKTSFSKTFFDLQNSETSKDLIFPERETNRIITDENEEAIQPENIFVIEPYNQDFSSDKTTLLLVNKDLKKEYDLSIKNIEEKSNVLNKKLKQLSGLTGRTITPTGEIDSCFNLTGANIYDFYEIILTEVTDKDRFSHITYSEVFNEKTLKILNSGNIKADIEEYIQKYNDLVEESPILNKSFNHYSASSVTKSLSDNGFFNANHTVNLSEGGDKTEITDIKELNTRFLQEKERIFTDKTLLKKFDTIDKKLSNAQLRKFRDYLFDNKDILPELSDFPELQKEIWRSYFYNAKDLLVDFVSTYQASKKIIEKVVKTAKEEETQWKEVVEIFNSRFSVPFKLKVENQDDVILKGATPQISFEFKDGTESNFINRSMLLQALSQGEKRALYILNLLFEINVRQRQNTETLFIVDDIADSFDYRNKYSIVEYLKEISTISFFHIIFLTHNFDFHRTISSRIGIPRNKRLFVIKNDTKIQLIKEKYQKNPFSYWKDNLESDQKYLIATIPFVRNIAEYCGEDDDFLKLTSLLHLKNDTNSLKISDLENIYKKILKDKSELNLSQPDKLVIDLIKEIASNIVNENSETVELEHKVILSISIRLYAEEFMKKQINDEVFFAEITSNQTFQLFERFSSDYPKETESIAILEQVNLMTPENIHLNSFMYEPILDMAALHLYELHEKVKQINES